MKKNILLFLFFMPFFIKAQSLSIDRINKIKDATVQILLPNGSTGTGFFIDNKGTIATCWHVIDTAYKAHVQVAIRVRSGKQYSADIDTNQKIDTCKKYDFCILRVVGLKNSPFLQFGSFDSTEEGSEIYTCGYPLGIPDQFVSKGMLSTKGFDVALMDITLNHGNSGGAIMQIDTKNNDKVIAIADFGLNPIQSQIDSIFTYLQGSIGNEIHSIPLPTPNTYAFFDPYVLQLKLARAINDMSIGVNGCYSIVFLKKEYERLNKGSSSHH